MRLRYFLSIDEHFGILRELGGEHQCRLIFRSFTADAPIASIKEIKWSVAEEVFRSGEYREMALSLGAVPRHDRDWDFMEKAAEELIVIEGGRQKEEVLELAEMRLFSKRSKAKRLFAKLRQRVLAACPHNGLKTLSGHPYEDIVYSQNIRQLDLRGKLHHNKPGSRFVVP